MNTEALNFSLLKLLFNVVVKTHTGKSLSDATDVGLTELSALKSFSKFSGLCFPEACASHRLISFVAIPCVTSKDS